MKVVLARKVFLVEETVITPVRVIKRLEASPVMLDLAIRLPNSGGVPVADGLYAWWVKQDALPGVPGRPHPTEPELRLLYVGISPRNASSKQNLRARLIGNHIGGNTGSSTFRFVLASFLLSELDLHPHKAKKKVVLDRGDNARLREWQAENLRLTWCERRAPWEIEAEVINEMKPPLNSAGNSTHPLYATVKASRAAFRDAAIAPN
ncbi:MAG: GIY-YIG nuclease family protein [Gaiellaceae bacterium]